ncbi:MAG: glutamine synthetase type III, partial [Treponema sp.]|nr:glutamine synthetase type III [Treponema sp.]
SISGPNTVLDSIVAYVLKEFADELEGKTDFQQALNELIKRELNAHWRIIFNGNGYDESWIKEAEKRGLLNLHNLPEAMERYLDPKNIKMYTELGIYNKTEIESHYEIKLEKYCHVLNIEVQTMLEMINKDILPAAFRYMRDVSRTAIDMEKALPGINCSTEKKLLMKLSGLTDELAQNAEKLSQEHAQTVGSKDYMSEAKSYAQNVIPAMEKTRAVADQIESLLGEEYKPYPSYEDLLFLV